MKEIHSSRFKDAPWFPKEEMYLIVGGAGGIGSWTSMLLARAGFFPIVYDFDILEEHNMAGQMYPTSMVDKPKVEALKILCKDFADTDIDIYNEKITEDTMSHKYVVSAFDNMEARKNMFASWCKVVEEWREDGGSDTPIFIDGRLRAEQMQIFCVTPNRIEAYKEHLFDDSEVEDAPCTLKQTSHSAAMIASHMVGFFTNHITNIVEGDTVRSVPFMWEYFIPINYLNEE